MALTLTKIVTTEESFSLDENMEKVIDYTKSEISAIINRQQIALVSHPSNESLVKNQIKNNLLSYGNFWFTQEDLRDIEEKLDEVVDFFVNADPGEKTIGEGEAKSSLITLVKDF